MTARTWEDDCARLSGWLRAHGRLPNSRSEDPAERSLYNWISRTRRDVKLGKASGKQSGLFDAAMAGFGRATASFELRLEQLEAFRRDHDRLPKTTAPEGSTERVLAVFLVHCLRPRLAQGQLSAERVAAASKIPGAVQIRAVPDQYDMLAALSCYAGRTGHMPPHGGRGTEEETRLANWWRNNAKGDPESKSPRLRERHLALLALEARYPGKTDAVFDTHLTQVEEFIRDHGHLPSAGASDTTAEERKLGLWLSMMRTSSTRRAASSEARFQALASVPTRTDVEWAANFEELKRYAAAHAGRLPARWDEGRVYSWLAVQRRTFRAGKLAPARIEQLLGVDGILPATASRLPAPVTVAA